MVTGKDYNIGQEAKMDLIDVNGNIINTFGLTEWDAKQQSNLITSEPISRKGKPVHRTAYKGWTGTMAIDRYNSDMDKLADLLEKNYFDGGPEMYFRVTVTERNPATGLDEQWMYNEVCLHMEDAGKRKTDEKVTQTFKWYSSSRQQLI